MGYFLVVDKEIGKKIFRKREKIWKIKEFI